MVRTFQLGQVTQTAVAGIPVLVTDETGSPLVGVPVEVSDPRTGSVLARFQTGQGGTATVSVDLSMLGPSGEVTIRPTVMGVFHIHPDSATVHAKTTHLLTFRLEGPRPVKVGPIVLIGISIVSIAVALGVFYNKPLVRNLLISIGGSAAVIGTAQAFSE